MLEIIISQIITRFSIIDNVKNLEIVSKTKKKLKEALFRPYAYMYVHTYQREDTLAHTHRFNEPGEGKRCGCGELEGYKHNEQIVD